MSLFDAAAPSFDRYRGLPDGVPEQIRRATLAALGASPRLLDLGAGTGRIGWPFVAAGDDYVGVDLSLGMLLQFWRRAGGHQPRLAQADGERLPFRNASFDAVMMVQIFGGLRGWRSVIDEARRVLRPSGALMLGRSVAPADGLDALMKGQLAADFGEMRTEAKPANFRKDVQECLEAAAANHTRVIAASWNAERTPRAFIERQRTGARFSALPPAIRDEALRRLGAWAKTRFGSLDTVTSERHEFELRIFRFR